jgi:hypothetical protein
MGWALKAGTVLQAMVIAAGIVVPAMYVLGVIFAALWGTGIWLARRHEPPRAGVKHQAGPGTPAAPAPGAPTRTGPAPGARAS